MNTISYILAVGTILATIIVLSNQFFKEACINFKTRTVECEFVTGKVIKKDHVVSNHEGESYLVWVNWNGLTQRLDNEDVYRNYRVGNQIRLSLAKRYDKRGKLLKEEMCK